MVVTLPFAATGTAGISAGGHDGLIGVAVGALIAGTVAIALGLLSRRHALQDAARARADAVAERDENLRADDRKWQRQERRALYARYISAVQAASG